MVKFSLISTLVIIAIPLETLAGTYDALCHGDQKCVVKILNNRLMVDEKVIPIEAVAKWTKAGPGLNSNSTLGAIATIFAAPAEGPGFYSLKSFKSEFNINYYTSEQKEDLVSIGFTNQSVSQFFESELQAATNLPKDTPNHDASQFKWKTADYPPLLSPNPNPSNTTP